VFVARPQKYKNVSRNTQTTIPKTNMDKNIKIASWSLLAVGILIIGVFFLFSFNDGYTIFGENFIEYDKTGQVGDFIGGIVGTIFALLGTILIYLNFREQVLQNKKEGFETIFLQLLTIQRDNVNQLNYTTSNSTEFSTAKDRKVFKVIFTEFLQCYREVKKFSNSINPEDYLTKKNQKFLENLIKKTV